MTYVPPAADCDERRGRLYSAAGHGMQGRHVISSDVEPLQLYLVAWRSVCVWRGLRPPHVIPIRAVVFEGGTCSD